jgi:hypothetical protein
MHSLSGGCGCGRTKGGCVMQLDLETLYAARVRVLEEEGLCTSDAQAVADVEFQKVKERLAERRRCEPAN